MSETNHVIYLGWEDYQFLIESLERLAEMSANLPDIRQLIKIIDIIKEQE